MNKIKRDDTVFVVKGRDRGRSGQVRKVLPWGTKTDEFGLEKPARIIVTGVNMVKRHMKPRGQNKPGGIVERESPIPWTNVAVLCASCNKPTRVGFRALADGRKVRFCKRCDATID
jgi:large subunit ribosomal protein L24